MTGGLTLSIAGTRAGDAVRFELEVANREPGLAEVRFRSGNTHDFVVFDDAGLEVWRWSEGRLFTQALQTRQLKSGDALRYEASWNRPTPGTYRVIAKLNSDTHPHEVSRDFTVR